MSCSPPGSPGSSRGAEPDSAAASLDWGFHLQLLFLTREPSLVEPFWKLQERGANAAPWRFSAGPKLRYLVHAERYDRAGTGRPLLEAAEALPEGTARIDTYRDREGEAVFMAVRIAEPHQLVYQRGRFAFALTRRQAAPPGRGRRPRRWSGRGAARGRAGRGGSARRSSCRRP